MKRTLLLVLLGLFAVLMLYPQTLPLPPYISTGSVSLALPTAPHLIAVDRYAYAAPTPITPTRPFLYTVDKSGLTIMRFNDNKVVSQSVDNLGTVLSTVPWPNNIWVIQPDGSWTNIPAPAGGWEPVGMTVSYPTQKEIGNRVGKLIPDLTPPPTFVYVVMAHSGVAWESSDGTIRDKLLPNPDRATDSSLLVQVDVSDPSFSTSRDPAAPLPPAIVAAVLGHGAGQPAYDPSTGLVYVGNLPSTTLLAGLASFVSVISRMDSEAAVPETETGPAGSPVIRCGPEHPETGIPVGRPQTFACYDPGGTHIIDDNQHVGASGNYFWEFRNLPPWLAAHVNRAGKLDGILYGTPPAAGEWFAEARVTNMDEVAEGGTPSEWTPIRFLVTPTAQYMPIKAQFAVGTPSAYPLETSSCTLAGQPAWVEVEPVTNGCIVMGTAPISGEHYQFTMGGITFSGNVVGPYGFDPLPAGVGLSGLAWHQVEKYDDPSTETDVLSVEFIGVEPSTGQLYNVVPPKGMPQPPNDRPPETALKLDTVSAVGTPLLPALLTARPDITGHLVRFGEVAVEADRDIFVAAVTDSTITDGALMKVNGAGISPIRIPGVQAFYLCLDSDLRPARVGVEPGQVDHGALWVTGTTSGKVAVINTVTGVVSSDNLLVTTSALGSVSVNFGTQYAYMAGESSNSISIFGPIGSALPLRPPVIWSAEGITFNRGGAGSFRVAATGDPVPTLALLGTLPDGLTFTPTPDGFATISGTPAASVEGTDYQFVITATNSVATSAQAFGIAIQTQPEITSVNAATFTAGVPGSFTVTTRGWLTPVIWELGALPNGVTFTDTEVGIAILAGTPATAGTYPITIHANGGFPNDGTQAFTLTVNALGTTMAPAITSPNRATFVIGGVEPPAPYLVTSTGSPTPTLAVTASTLPIGVTFQNNGNSTGTLAGVPIKTGTYTFTITATNGAGSATQTFTLVVEAEDSMLSVAPETLSFVADATLPGPQTFTLTTSGATLHYAATTTESWLAVSPVSGTTPATISVSVNSLNLPVGTYTGTVMINNAITEGPPATVAVTLNKTAPPVPNMMGVWPGRLDFAFQAGGTAPAPRTLSLNTGGASLHYTVSTNGSKWLSATPASGIAPGPLTVAADPKAGVGLHVAELMITSTDALGAPTFKVPVTLLKTAADNDLMQVTFDVGGSPEGLAINRNTHNLFITTAIDVETGSEAGGEGAAEPPEAADPSAGSAVFHIDPVNQKLIAAIPVHSEGEYVAVNSTTGRAYHASQGTGEVAVIDGATNTVLAFVPLTHEGGTYQPYQIAIDEAQNLIYVGAKAPPIPDPVKVAGQSFPCKAIHEMPDDEYDCWNPGKVFVIDGNTNQVVSFFNAGDDPEGVVFAAKTGKVYASNEDDGSITVAKAAIRNGNGSITPPVVLRTIIKGVPVAGWWQPTCDTNNYCGERGQAALWPTKSDCNGKDDEAEEADKMAVDPDGNVYIIDDRYRVAKIIGNTDIVVTPVLAIPGYACELEVADGSNTVFPNTANNIAFMASGQGKLYVTSEQNTVSIIDPKTMTIKATVTVQGAVELDAITTDPGLNRVYITDEGQAALWILKGACANGTGNCVVK